MKRKVFLYFVKTMLILLVFWVLINLILRAIDYTAGLRIQKDIVEKINNGDFESLREDIHNYEWEVPLRKWSYFSEQTWFYDNNNEEWIRENYGEYPRMEENTVFSVIYYTELTPGEYKGRSGFFTTKITAYPYTIGKSIEKLLHDIHKFFGIGIMVAIAVISVLEYNKLKYSEKTSKELLLNGLARDMKEPLSSLTTAVEEWKHSTGVDRKNCSDKVISEVERMDEIIRKQLKLRDIENGNVDLHMEEVNLYYFVHMIIEHLKPILQKRGIEIHVNCENTEDCIVQADRELLKMALINTLTVAMEHSSFLDVTIYHANSDSSVCLNADCRLWTISQDRADNIFKNMFYYDESRIDSLGSEGVGLAGIAPLLKVQGINYGCYPVANNTRLWFSMKRINTDDE